MDWRQILMDAVVVAIIGGVALLLAAFIAEFFMAHRVMKRLESLQLDKEHIHRKDEHRKLDQDHTVLIERNSNIQNSLSEIGLTTKTIADKQHQEELRTLEKQHQLEILKENQKEISRSINNVLLLKEQWLAVNMECTQLKRENADLKLRETQLTGQCNRLAARYNALLPRQNLNEEDMDLEI